MRIYLRKENNDNEFRTPLIPEHIKILIHNNYTVYVKSSNTRIYNLNAHKHIYFSHSFKNQQNSDIILKSFYKSSSIIYDFEYFLDDYGKRLLAFGFYAGIVGGVLGLIHYTHGLTTLTPYENKDVLIKPLKNYDMSSFKIAIIGPNGRCGLGVIDILNELSIPYTKFYRDSSKNNLKDFDIIYNCINLSGNLAEVWFDSNTEFYKKIVIVDISCDYLSLNNPIKLYNKNTTFDEPVFKYNEFVDIIAINNLPSLLPKESSDYFSAKFIELLLNPRNYWQKNNSVFNAFIAVISQG